MSDRTAALIEAHGWAVILVPDSDDGPGFGYTIGLAQRFRHAELLMQGLPLETIHAALNNAAAEVQRGARFMPGSRSGEVFEEAPVACRAVDARFFDEYFGTAFRYYGDAPFDVLQLVWVDDELRFPDDAGCDVDVVEAQRLRLPGE
jgi:hypothetical protein